MNLIKNQIKQLVQKHLVKLDSGLADLAFIVEYPTTEKFGDYTVSVALKAGKLLKLPPLELAGKLADSLKKDTKIAKIFSKIEVVAPGFINFYLSEEFLNNRAKEVLSQKEKFGQVVSRKSQKIQLEFISANPTGPLTVGNGRGGFYGDVLGNVLKLCGHSVVKEYLINDAGNQIASLGHSVLKDELAVYKGEYIDELHGRLKNLVEPMAVGQWAAEIILHELLQQTIEEGMKIKFDVWFSENKELRESQKIEKVIAWLKAKNYLYESEGAWWFKSSEHGDTRDRVLVKGNGEFTYLAQDFAYLVNKFSERKFDLVINIWGADHHGDVPGLLAAADVLGYKDKQIVTLMQFVRLFKDGKEVRMSKRMGTYVAMSELLEMVDHDAVRFLFLMYSNNSHINFDLNLAQERSEKNPVYYVQYAYARISGILRQPESVNVSLAGKLELEYQEEAERSLLKTLLKLPEILEQISEDYEVQKLPGYAIEIADKFHQFYNTCRVIDDGKANTSRLALVKLTQKVLGEVLEIIGISAPEKM
ncbi:MAG: arginine--tRNA ligase [Patescibacteria group bacterium]|jgi:arginyl-tRNA synthetase